MAFTTVSMNTWLYPDSKVESEQHTIKLNAVRGGSAGFQILCTDLKAGRLNVTATAPDGAQCTVEAYRELSVRVEKNTGPKGFTADWEIAKEYSTREAPFRVYDALEPVPESGLDIPDGTQAVYVALTVARDCVPGKYSGKVCVDAGGQSMTVEYELCAAEAELPAESLNVTLWYSVGSMAAAHGLEKWSEAHWNMIREYGKLMRRMHQNVFWITWDTVEASVCEDGSYAFDFTNCERLIKLFFDMGFTTIEGAPIYGRDNWDAAEFKVNTPKGRVLALSRESYEYVTALLTAWHDFLKEHGWYEHTIQHVGDEPHELAAAEYRILSGIVRKYMPGVKLIDAIETYELEGSMDIWVPKNDYYQKNRTEMERLRRLGDEVWFYTCCKPGGHFCNRLLDMPLIRTRMLFWGNFKYDLTGYLHWGLNHWNIEKQNPYEDTCPQSSPTTWWPSGDTHIVYPLSGGVIGSMRAEMTRGGTEDYELLKLLSKTQPERAKAICDRMFRAFDDCDNSAADFDAAHDELVMSVK